MRFQKDLCKLINSFPSKYIILIKGSPATEKEFIAYKIMCDNLSKDYIFYYLYHGRTNTEVEQEFKNYGINVTNLIKNKKIFWMDASHISKGSNVINCDIANLFTLSLAMRKFLLKNKDKKIFGIIDILSPAIMMNDNVVIFRFVEDIITALKRQNTKTIMLLEEGAHPKEIVIAIEHFCDCVIEISLMEKNFKIHKILKFEKLKGMLMQDKYFKLNITKEAIRIENLLKETNKI